MPRALLPLALLVASSGCIIIVKDGDEPYPDDPTVPVVVDSGMVDCEHSPTPSVLVHVVDEGGAPVTPNELSWSSGGEPPQPAECADESCTTWIAGYDVAGDINVTASVLLASETPGCWWEGSASATVNVLIDDGYCPAVMTQDLTLTLDASGFSLVCGEDDGGGEAPGGADSGPC